MNKPSENSWFGSAMRASRDRGERVCGEVSERLRELASGGSKTERAMADAEQESIHSPEKNAEM